MKKILVLALSALIFAAAASAQPRALGLRFGGAGYSGFAYGAEISYQHFCGPGFVEADFGWSSVGINGTAIWDWMALEARHVNLYIGPGVNVGLYETGDNSTTLCLGAVGQIGVEYQFGTLPLNVSLDWRPGFYLLPSTRFSPYGVALGVRYRF